MDGEKLGWARRWSVRCYRKGIKSGVRETRLVPSLPAISVVTSPNFSFPSHNLVKQVGVYTACFTGLPKRAVRKEIGACVLVSWELILSSQPEWKLLNFRDCYFHLFFSSVNKSLSSAHFVPLRSVLDILQLPRQTKIPTFLGLAIWKGRQ